MSNDARLSTESLPGSAQDPLAAVAIELDEVAQRVSRSEPEHTLDEVTAAAVRLLRPAGWASVSLLDKGHFRTLAPTGDLALRADQLQYDVGCGPCVDAALEDSVFVTEDLGRDERWPQFASRAVEELGVHSMLSYRLSLPEKLGAVAGLNVYALIPEGFEDDAIWRGLLLASQASLALSAQLALEEADNLRLALSSNREIGVAIGILMNRHLLTRDQAFDALRTVSQDQNRKLVVVAAEVVETGDLMSARQPAGPYPTNGEDDGSSHLRPPARQEGRTDG